MGTLEVALVADELVLLGTFDVKVPFVDADALVVVLVAVVVELDVVELLLVVLLLDVVLDEEEEEELPLIENIGL